VIQSDNCNQLHFIVINRPSQETVLTSMTQTSGKQIPTVTFTDRCFNDCLSRIHLINTSRISFRFTQYQTEKHNWQSIFSPM